MKLLTTAVLLVLSVIARANSESHGAPVPVAAPKKVGSVYLVPVFVPNQEEYANGGEGGLGSYREPTPLQKIVLGYTPREQQYGNADLQQAPFIHEIVNSRQRRSPGRGRGGGGGGGTGSSGSWSKSSSSSSSGSWGGGSGGGKGSGKGK